MLATMGMEPNSGTPSGAASGKPPNPPDQALTSPDIPVSLLSDSIADLIQQRGLTPPSRLGLSGELDRFEILRPLGEGGMGIVLLARDTRDARLVAIKMLRPEFREQPRIAERFLHEARLQQQLKHPHLLPVLEVCERPQGSYFVMPYCDRGSLAQLLQPGTPLDTATILPIALAVAEALSAAHAENIVHRDLKPGNILLNSDGTAWVGDFGLAKPFSNEAIKEVGREKGEGTVPYMSPAVAAGQAEDTRCDIYSFGAVLYEMLTSQAPYRGSSADAVRPLIVAGPPVAIEKLNPKADAGLRAIAEGAMAREHRDRYANMVDVVADLQRRQQGKAPLGPGRTVWHPKALLEAVPPRVARWLAVAGCAGLVLLVGWLAWPKPKFERVQTIITPLVPSWKAGQVSTWEGFSGPKVLVPSEGRLLVYDMQGQVLSRWPLRQGQAKDIRVVKTMDVEADGTEEALVTWVDGTNSALSVINANMLELARFATPAGEFLEKNKYFGAIFDLVEVIPPAQSRDGRRKVISTITSGYGSGPRGLDCYDYETGTNVWSLRGASQFFSLATLDLDQDGILEVLTGSSANNNIRSDAMGFTDAVSALFAWSDTGKLLWRKELGGVFSSVALLWAGTNAHGVPRILAAVRTHEQDHAKHVSRVFWMDAQGNELQSYNPNACLKSFLITDLNQDGNREILCSDCQGWSHVLNDELKLLRKVQVIKGWTPRPDSLDHVIIEFQQCADFDASGRKHVLAKSAIFPEGKDFNPGNLKKPSTTNPKNVQLLMLDEELRVVAHHLLARKASAEHHWTPLSADVDDDGAQEILLLSDRLEILKFRPR